jgi:uncharacterized protein (DUF1810 family)
MVCRSYDAEHRRDSIDVGVLHRGSTRDVTRSRSQRRPLLNDELQLRSSATSFAAVSDEAVFDDVLEKYFDGKHDEETLRRLRS